MVTMISTTCRTVKMSLLSEKPAMCTNSLQANERQNEDALSYVEGVQSSMNLYTTRSI